MCRAASQKQTVNCAMAANSCPRPDRNGHKRTLLVSVLHRIAGDALIIYIDARIVLMCSFMKLQVYNINLSWQYS
jgi:hypothetical protein